MFADPLTVNSVSYPAFRRQGEQSSFRKTGYTADNQQLLNISHASAKGGVTRSLAQMKLTQVHATTGVKEEVTLNVTLTRADFRTVISDAEISALWADLISFINDSGVQAKILGKEV